MVNTPHGLSWVFLLVEFINTYITLKDPYKGAIRDAIDEQ